MFIFITTIFSAQIPPRMIPPGIILIGLLLLLLHLVLPTKPVAVVCCVQCLAMYGTWQRHCLSDGLERTAMRGRIAHTFKLACRSLLVVVNRHLLITLTSKLVASDINRQQRQHTT